MVLHKNLNISINNHFGSTHEIEILQQIGENSQSPPLNESRELGEDELEKDLLPIHEKDLLPMAQSSTCIHVQHTAYNSR